MILFVDNSEQLPYEFIGITCEDEYEVITTSLDTADYAVSQDEAVKGVGGLKIGDKKRQCIVERKTLTDLYQTLTRNRERFFKEALRMMEYGYSAIMIEATWEMIANPNDYLRHETKAHPRSIVQSLLALTERYGIHIFTLPNREAAERMTFRILERWWNDRSPF